MKQEDAKKEAQRILHAPEAQQLLALLSRGGGQTLQQCPLLYSISRVPDMCGLSMCSQFHHLLSKVFNISVPVSVTRTSSSMRQPP